MYDSQQKMIYTLLESFKSRGQQKSLIESPTGSGKSACCIAAYSGYYHTYVMAAQLLRMIYNITINKSDYTQQSIYETLQKRNLIQYNQQTFDILFNFMQEYNPIQQCIQIHRTYITCIIDDEKLTPPVLIYCSRTHEQLKQLNQSTISLFNNGLNVAYISSREIQCNNQKALDFAKEQQKNLKLVCKALCQTNQCNFQLQNKDYIYAKDIEELKDACTQQSICSYHHSINIVENSQIILSPYNYLVSPELQEQIIKDRIVGSIIIFDEAHSLSSFCKNAFSATFTRQDIMNAEDNLFLAIDILRTQINKEDMKNKTSKSNQQNIIKLQAFQLFQQIIHQLLLNIQNIMILTDQNQLFVHNSLILYSKIPLLSVSQQLIEYEAEVEQVIFQHYLSLLRQGLSEDEPIIKNLQRVRYGSFQKFSEVLNIGLYIADDENNFDSFKVIINQNESNKDDKQQNKYYSTNKPNKITFELSCFTPKIAFKKLLQKRPMSINFISGTLSPMKFIEDEYDCKFNIQISLNHIANLDKQLICYNITAIQQKYQFIGTYNNRDQEYFTNVCRAILVVTQNVPKGCGCLIFVASYQVLQQFQRIQQMIVQWQKHTDTQIIFEEKGENIIQQFKESVLEDKKRTLLFAVLRGQLAEGIDFKDDLCRCIIVVGIPFPDKSIWLDNQGGEMRSKQYLMREAFTAINQAIGRGIRHINDYCEIVLLDQRYQKYLNYLPEYIRDRVQQIKLQQDDSVQFRDVKYFDKTVSQTMEKQDKKLSDQDLSNSLQDNSISDEIQQTQQQSQYQQQNSIKDDYVKETFVKESQKRLQNSKNDELQLEQYFIEKQIYSVLEQLRKCNKFLILMKFKNAIKQVNNIQCLISLVNEFQNQQSRSKLIQIILSEK